jgi:histidyl-tRNA synthetase
LEELYKRKAGEDITKQMYNFEDKDKELVALRPEMTPSLARLILKRGKTMLLPVRWFTVAQCWRFETIQLGRKREHYQWNMDVIGVGAVTCEVELLSAITSFFSRVGLTSADVGIKVNSRKVLQQVLEPLGVVGDKFAPVCVVVDKLDKLTEEEVHKELTALSLGPEIIAKITEALGIKDLEALEAMLGPTNAAVVELKQLWTLAEAYGFADWLIFDASVVRGLAYYTGVVFEAFDRQKQFRAICGGGRYDGLLSLYGSKEVIPAAGFGMGDVVIIELLKAKGLLPDLPPQVDVMVVPFDENLRPAACQVAAKLRALGKRVEIQLIPKKKIGWCYELADRIGANQLCFVAPDEWAAGKVRIKNLRLPEDAPNKQFDIEVSKLDTI